MEASSWKPIKSFLDNLEPLKPVESSVQEKIRPLQNIRAVVFDIYGTLLISDSGGIEQSEMSPKFLSYAFREANIPLLTKSKDSTDQLLDDILLMFREKIEHVHEEKKENNIPFPEINILDIWEQILQHFNEEGKISFFSDSDIRIFSMLFELLSNRVYPMPGMKDVLVKLNSMRYPLGIISNAQFYTPLIMNYFLTGNIQDKETIKFFEPDITFYSYRLGRAKPDSLAFKDTGEILYEKYGLNTQNILYIGNDIYNDIYPAKKMGYKTALFAGDKRSLRLRKDFRILEDIQPDVVIKKLNSIFDIME
ncbi:MAG: HAD family hydrolase [Bacteroidales bacterium]